MDACLDLAYRPFQFCSFGQEEVLPTVVEAVRQAAHELNIALPTDLRVIVRDIPTKDGGTGGVFLKPLSGFNRPACMVLSVCGGSSLADLSRTGRHETYHLFEWLTRPDERLDPYYNEDLAGRFASPLGTPV